MVLFGFRRKFRGRFFSSVNTLSSSLFLEKLSSKEPTLFMKNNICFGLDTFLRRGSMLMRLNSFCLTTLVLTAASIVAADVESGCQRADLLFRSGTIYTADAGNSKHQALVINDGRFVFVGTDELAERLWCDAERVIDLKGAAVFPMKKQGSGPPQKPSVGLVVRPASITGWMRPETLTWALGVPANTMSTSISTSM